MKRSRSRGFTLLELVVAMGIFALLALMAYGGLDSVLSGRRAIEQRLERTAQLQKAYIRMRADFQQISPRAVRDEFGDTQPAFVLSVSNQSLEFTRGGWRNPRFQPRPSLERVAYRLYDKKLLRSSWRTLDRVQGAEPAELVVLDGVDEISWRFLDGNLDWQSAWPPPNQRGEKQSPAPPRALELTLQTKDWSELKLLFRLGLTSAAGTP